MVDFLPPSLFFVICFYDFVSGRIEISDGGRIRFCLSFSNPSGRPVESRDGNMKSLVRFYLSFSILLALATGSFSENRYRNVESFVASTVGRLIVSSVS